MVYQLRPLLLGVVLAAIGGPAAAEDIATLREELARVELGGISAHPRMFQRLADLERRTTHPVLRLEIERFRAECKRKGGLFDDARRGFRAVAGSPHATPYLRLLAMKSAAETEWAAGDLEAAERGFRGLLEETKAVPDSSGDPQLTMLLEWLPVAAAHHVGAILSGRQLADAAVEAYEHAIRLNTPPRPEAQRRGFTNARAAVNVAVICINQEQMERGLHYFRRAREFDADFMPAYIEHQLLVGAGLERGSTARVHALDTLLKRFPEDPWVTVIRLDLYHDLREIGDTELAHRYLDSILQGEPADPGVYGGLVRINEVEAHLAHVDALIAQGKYAEAEVAAGVLLQRYEETPQAQDVREKTIPYLAELRRLGETSNRPPRGVAAGPQEPEGGPRLALLVAVNGGVLACAVAVWALRRRRKARKETVA